MADDRWDGRKYRENSDPQERFALTGVDRLALNGDERVLDVGCGDGRITAEIARRVRNGSVLGLDASPSMIAACEEAHGAVTNLSFRAADATSFRVDAPFDAAVSFSARHWIEDLRAALGCVRNALKPGGAFVIGMGEGQQEEIAEVFRRERWRGRISRQPRAFHGRAREELAKLLSECGFADVEVEVVSGARPYADEQALLDWIMAWLPHATGLSGGDALEFGRDIVENVRASRPPGTTGLAMRWSMLAAKAIRS
jgi:trans-aconitate 2-methyltransferase